MHSLFLIGTTPAPVYPSFTWDRKDHDTRVSNLWYRECYCKTYCWKELNFQFSPKNLNRNMQSPSMWWWLITQLKPIWKKAPSDLQRPIWKCSTTPNFLRPNWPYTQVSHHLKGAFGLMPSCDPSIINWFRSLFKRPEFLAKLFNRGLPSAGLMSHQMFSADD